MLELQKTFVDAAPPMAPLAENRKAVRQLVAGFIFPNAAELISLVQVPTLGDVLGDEGA